MLQHRSHPIKYFNVSSVAVFSSGSILDFTSYVVVALGGFPFGFSVAISCCPGLFQVGQRRQVVEDCCWYDGETLVSGSLLSTVRMHGMGPKEGYLEPCVLVSGILVVQQV